MTVNTLSGEIHRAKPNRFKQTVTYRVFPPGPAPPEFDTVTGPSVPRQTIKTDPELIETGHSRETWIYSLISAMLVGLSGIFPLLVIPLEAGKALRKGGKFLPTGRAHCHHRHSHVMIDKLSLLAMYVSSIYYIIPAAFSYYDMMIFREFNMFNQMDSV